MKTFKVVQENGLFGITDENGVLGVPCIHNSQLGAISEFEYFEVLNCKKQFLPHQLSQKEITNIVNQLKNQQIG